MMVSSGTCPGHVQKVEDSTQTHPHTEILRNTEFLTQTGLLGRVCKISKQTGLKFHFKFIVVFSSE